MSGKFPESNNDPEAVTFIVSGAEFVQTKITQGFNQMKLQECRIINDEGFISLFKGGPSEQKDLTHDVLAESLRSFQLT